MEFIINYYFDFDRMISELNPLLRGFWVTIKLAVLGGIFSLAWGLVLAVLRQMPGKAAFPIRFLAITYIDVFRGIPMLLVLLLVSGSLSAFAFEGTIPTWLGQPRWLGESPPFWWGVMALTITYGAYMAEVYRAGIEAVPRGQMEAARSLGMSHGQAMRNVILPQAIRKVVPPLLNDYIALMKDTSLVVVIGLVDVVAAGRDVQNTYISGAGLIVAALLFLLFTLPLARFVDWLIAREQGRTGRGGPAAPVGGAPAPVAGPQAS